MVNPLSPNSFKQFTPGIGPQQNTTNIGKNLKFSVLLGTATKSTETRSSDETQTDYMHFEVGIKMHALSLCFISAAFFSAFYRSPY